MGVPAVEVSAIPMAKALPNVFDLPLISRFVKMAIAAGTAEFVAPKSMTLNIQEILSGAAIGGMSENADRFLSQQSVRYSFCWGFPHRHPSRRRIIGSGQQWSFRSVHCRCIRQGKFIVES